MKNKKQIKYMRDHIDGDAEEIIRLRNRIIHDRRSIIHLVGRMDAMQGVLLNMCDFCYSCNGKPKYIGDSVHVCGGTDFELEDVMDGMMVEQYHYQVKDDGGG